MEQEHGAVTGRKDRITTRVSGSHVGTRKPGEKAGSQGTGKGQRPALKRSLSARSQVQDPGRDAGDRSAETKGGETRVVVTRLRAPRQNWAWGSHARRKRQKGLLCPIRGARWPCYHRYLRLAACRRGPGCCPARLERCKRGARRREEQEPSAAICSSRLYTCQKYL